uniref:Uncharacterized protein n=1 Tax=Arundo donax TaxID=35708 RepID=A0A0A9EIN7_ARUDO
MLLCPSSRFFSPSIQDFLSLSIISCLCLLFLEENILLARLL